MLLLKYLAPVAALVLFQIVSNSKWAEAESTEMSDDLESAELFLRPVVVKYGHDSGGVYTWQGASGTGGGWGVYKPQTMMMVPMQPMQQGGGWGWKRPYYGWANVNAWQTPHAYQYGLQEQGKGYQKYIWQGADFHKGWGHGGGYAG